MRLQPLFHRHTHLFVNLEALQSLISITQKSPHKNGLAIMSNDILTNKDLSENVALRAELQDMMPDPSRVIVIDKGTDAEHSVPINAMRIGKKATPDASRMYNNQLDRTVVKELFSDVQSKVGSLKDEKRGRFDSAFCSPQDKPPQDGAGITTLAVFDAKSSSKSSKQGRH